jgi:hypothetical protein
MLDIEKKWGYLGNQEAIRVNRLSLNLNRLNPDKALAFVRGGAESCGSKQKDGRAAGVSTSGSSAFLEVDS